jgi:XTP/dITP diphosphohydrolase
MKKLLIATHNPGKIAELRSLLSDLPLQLVSLSEIGINEEAEENGTTYKENSQIKALFYAKKSKLPALADDAGVEIAALNNEPGVNTKHWFGPGTTEDDIIEHMKKVAKTLPDDNRKATFKAVVSLALPDGKVWSVLGTIEGIIAKKPSIKKTKGYPFRSFFYLPQIKKYYFETELTPQEQKKYNHRVKAVNKIKPIIQKNLI